MRGSVQMTAPIEKNTQGKVNRQMNTTLFQLQWGMQRVNKSSWGCRQLRRRRNAWAALE